MLKEGRLQYGGGKTVLQEKHKKITHARGRMMEAAFYKRTDYCNHENDSAGSSQQV